MNQVKREQRVLVLHPCKEHVIAAIFRGVERIEHLFFANDVAELTVNKKFVRILDQVTLMYCDNKILPSCNVLHTQIPNCKIIQELKDLDTINQILDSICREYNMIKESIKLLQGKG